MFIRTRERPSLENAPNIQDITDVLGKSPRLRLSNAFSSLHSKRSFAFEFAACREMFIVVEKCFPSALGRRALIKQDTRHSH